MTINKTQFEAALKLTIGLLKETDLEPTSAMKQAATMNDIPEGEWLKFFVEWAHEQLGLEV